MNNTAAIVKWVEAIETMQVFLLIPLFSTEGLGQIGSIKNNH